MAKKSHKTIAVILAGGSGNRMGQDIPKQFINVNDKPIIIYTLEAFQNHPDIDEIEVVCREGWENILKAYAKQFGITKLKYIAKPGNTCQESIFSGIKNLRGKIKKDDIVVIHDGVRPLVDDYVLSDVIATCEKFGNGVTSTPYNEQIFRADENDPNTTIEYIPRDRLRRVATPQAYHFGEINDAYEEAFSKHIDIVSGPTYANTTLVALGKRLYFANGSDRNIKLTTTADIELFSAMLKTKKADWLK